jgi:ferredoxin-thioredoxin reductase catalytic subunit
MRKKWMKPCIYREPELLETGNAVIRDITLEPES